MIYFSTACGDGRIVEIRDPPLPRQSGCKTNAECDDGDTLTEDRCEIAHGTIGICHHVRPGGFVLCNTDRDCNDDHADTEDVCRGGVCHHTYPPAVNTETEGRQNARYICEDDIVCGPSPGGPITTLDPTISCSSHTTREPWWEDGYPLVVHIDRANSITQAVLRLALRVGDRRDTYLVSARINSPFRDPPIIRQVMSVPAIESGLAFTVNPDDRVSGSPDRITLFIRLSVIGRMRSRTIQWGIPTNGLSNEGDAWETCAASGLFMETPRHGQLHLRTGYEGEPRCDGEPAATDVERGDPLAGIGYVRELSDPTLVYIASASFRRVIHFRGLEGLADWLAPSIACASAKVVPDGEIVRLNWPSLTVGIRPGVLVAWERDRVVRYGIADHSGRVREYGDVAPYELGVCTSANVFLMLFDTRIPLCALFLRNGGEGYRLVPAMTGWNGHETFERATLENYYGLY